MTHPPPTQSSSDRAADSVTVYVLVGSSELAVVATALRAGKLRTVELDPDSFDPVSIRKRPCIIVADIVGDRRARILPRLSQLTEASRIDLIAVIDEPSLSILDGVPAGMPFHPFPRPINVAAMVTTVCELLPGGMLNPGPSERSPTPKPSSSSRPYADDAPSPVSSPYLRLPPPSPLLSYAPGPWQGSEFAPPGSSPPRSWPSSIPPAFSPPASLRRSFAGPTSISPDLDSLLASAAQRVFSEPMLVPDIPSPEEEVDAILPPELLASLDEPLDAESDDEDLSEGRSMRTPIGHVTMSPRRTDTTGTSPAVTGASGGSALGASAEPITAAGEGNTHGGGRSTTDASARDLARGNNRSANGAAFGGAAGGDTVPPEPHRPVFRMSAISPSFASGLAPGDAAVDRVASGTSPSHDTAVPRLPQRSHTVPSPQKVLASEVNDASPPEAAQQDAPALPSVLSSSFDGLRWLAAFVANRNSGTVCFDDAGVQRRAVMRDGDFVASASSSPHETLTSWLLERGDLQREVAAHLSARIPPFGRHAAAALIANGYMGQDQLWPILRGHAEWLLARMVRSASGSAVADTEPPGRLRAEPSAFGGATGAEVLVEVTRRALPASEALARLGGPDAMIAAGRNGTLLGECALDTLEESAARKCDGMSVRQAIERAGDREEFASVLCVLKDLGVLELIPRIRGSVGTQSAHDAQGDELDADAVRQRIRARLAVIEEGDYFQVLGVPKSATSYELRRAYLEGRRALEPSRLLTVATVDMLDDVQLVLEVMEEAYEVLRDDARRTRYLRALDARPPVRA